MLLRLNDFFVQNINPNDIVNFSAEMIKIKDIPNEKRILGSIKINITNLSPANNKSLSYDIMNFIIDDTNITIPELGAESIPKIDTDEEFKNKIDLFGDILWGVARTLSQIYFEELKSGKQTFDAPAQVTNFINSKLKLDDKKFIITAFNEYEAYRKLFNITPIKNEFFITKD